MTEQFIRDVAAQHGLSVLKRITTGNDKQHFATFELSGPPASVLTAWHDIHAKNAAEGRRHMDRITHVDNRDHADYGKPMIELTSVWCE